MAENEDNILDGVSLADLAGLNTEGMESKRIGDILPRFLGDFECVEAALKEVKEGEKIKGFSAAFEWKVLGVHALIDKDAKEEELIGKKHFENRFIKNEDGIKFLLGFLEDIGIKERGTLGGLIERAKGRKVKAIISHRKDKNDSERTYSGFAKIKPLE